LALEQGISALAELLPECQLSRSENLSRIVSILTAPI
jgi:hypothetical protein